MSIALMTMAWKTSLPASQKMALLAMCDWANDEGGSLHPSISRVAQRVSCSERQAQRVIHSLVDDGWLMVVGNANGGAPGQSRRYQISVRKLEESVADAAKKHSKTVAKSPAILNETGDMGVTGGKLSRVTPVTPTGDMGDARRVTPVTPTGDMGVTLTTIEPSIEPSGGCSGEQAKPAKPKKSMASLTAEKTFSAWMDVMKASGEQPIPDGDPIFDYADRIELPDAFLKLAWLEFQKRYGNSTKKYKDWRGVYRNAIRGDWFRLWRATPDGGYVLTTAGFQAQRVLDAKQGVAA